MVVKTVQEDIFNTEAKHIAFAVNTEGFNDSGFARQVSGQYWKELAYCGEQKLGEVLSKQVGDKTFHALVCHSLKEGWGENQLEMIKQCFDKIQSNGEPIATVAIGTGMSGQKNGADFGQIIRGMHDSQQQIMLHAEFTLDSVIEYCNEEKAKAKGFRK